MKVTFEATPEELIKLASSREDGSSETDLNLAEHEIELASLWLGRNIPKGLRWWEGAYEPKKK